MKPLLAETLCAGVAILAYINTFGAKFVYDDSRAILSNLDVRTSTPLRRVFFNDFWGTPMIHSGSHKSYRPLTTLTFRLNYALSGFHPWSYHVINVFLHSLATWLFVSFTKKRIFSAKDARKSWSAGLLFAVHPVHTEAVAGVVGRADVLSAVFVLACLLSYESHCSWVESANCDVSKDRSGFIPGVTSRTTGRGESDKRAAKQRWKNKTTKRNGRKPAAKQNPASSCHRDGLCQKCCRSQESARKSADVLSRSNERNVSDLSPLWLPFVFAACAVFSKETGLCALPLCAVYDVWVRNRLGALSAAKTLLFWGDHSRCHPLLRRRFWTLAIGAIALFGARVLPWKMLSAGPTVSPPFSAADNPASFSESFLTRTLTFNYLLSFNAMLLVFPTTLSYDWGDVKLVESLWDLRNWCTLVFFATSGLALRSVWVRLRVLDSVSCTKHCVKTRPIDCKTSTSSSENVREKLRSFRIASHETNEVEIRKQSEIAQPNVIIKALSRETMKLAALPVTDEGIYLNSSNFQTDNTVASLTLKYENVATPFRVVDREFSNQRAGVFEAPESTNSSGYATEGSEEGGHDDKRGNNSSITSAHSAGFLRVDLATKPLDGGAHCDACMALMAAAMVALPFLPATNLFFYVGFVAAERILYLPSAGYCILVAHGWGKMEQTVACKLAWKNRRKGVLNLTIIVGWIILASLFLRTVVRNSDWSDELHLYRSGIATSPAKSWSNLGNVMKELGRTDEAETCYLNGLKRRGNMADVHYNLGLLYQEQKRNAEALARYQAAILYRPTLAVAYLNSGSVLAELGRADEAEKMYRHTVRIDDTGLKNPQAHAKAKISALYNLGCLLSSKGRHGEAVESFEKAVTRLTPDYEPQSLYNMLGQSLFKLKRMDEAEKWFEAALKAKRDHIPAHLTYAMLLRETKRLHLAEGTYRRALEMAPDNHLIYCHYAKHCTEQGRHADAASLMARGATTKSGSSDYGTMMSAGDAHRQLADYEKAESYYRKATKINPQAAGGFVNLGATLHLRGKYPEAKRSYEKALILSPDESIAIQNLHKLDDILKSRDGNQL